MAFVSKRVLGSAAGFPCGFAPPWSVSLFLSLITFVLGAQAAAPGEGASSAGRLQFNKDIRPILADNCFQCHGFDGGHREAGLRLDTFEGATAVKDAHQAVKPGDLKTSELWRRVNSTDPKVHMPPPDSGKELQPSQMDRARGGVSETLGVRADFPPRTALVQV
jgi:mono/diheme cytochrome c family protein